MAELLKVTRPDGKTVMVTPKHFERSLRGKGYTEAKEEKPAPKSQGKTQKDEA